MGKNCNTTGLCFPADHYVVYTFRNLYKAMYPLIEQKNISSFTPVGIRESLGNLNP